MAEHSITYATSYRFHGGIHPDTFKDLSSHEPIRRLPLPSQLVIPLKQHIGPSCLSVVKPKAKVRKGQLIAQSKSGDIHLHAPTAGIVTAIESAYLGHPSGQAAEAIFIQVDSESSQTSPVFEPIVEWSDASKEQLLERAKLAGLVGLGGATFPSHIKLASQSIELLIVNAMECEPYITCDDRLMQEYSCEILQGALIGAKITGAKKIIFATEDNKPDAVAHLESAICQLSQEARRPQISICVAPTKYPSGGEKQIIELVTGQQVPSGKLPSSLGIVVHNVATLYALQQSVVKGLSLTERLVTITGDCVANPGNYWIPFGTSVQDIVDALEIKPAFSGFIIGGPMMGQSLRDTSVPVTKATNCLIFNRETTETKSWILNATEHRACIRCGECQQVCPAQLLPQQLYWFSQSHQWDKLKEQALMDCIECGACAYVCPSEIPLVHYFRFGKSSLKNQDKSKAKSEKARSRFEFREARLERLKRERASKHQKAAEARGAEKTSTQVEESTKSEAINEALARVQRKKANQTTLQHHAAEQATLVQPSVEKNENKS